MKFATIEIKNPKNYSEKRDGQLVIVATDERSGILVPRSEFPSLVFCLENWDLALTRFKELQKTGDAIDLSQVIFKSPVPRTYQWLDGSAYIQHILLVRKARGVEPPKTLSTDPLMYQGISDYLDGPNDDIPCIDLNHGVDLEGEVGVLLDETPMGVSVESARSHIKLLTLINDVSLRGLIPAELEKGFGFLHGKPSTAFAPFAVTPDELGSAWMDGRVHLNVECSINGKFLGNPSAAEMHFNFDQLIAHAAKTRRLSPGTFIGSGTVSNKDEARGVACLAEKRMLEIIKAREANPDKPELHKPSTPFLKPGDVVEIDMLKDGKSVFGRIKQKVVSWPK